METHAIETTNKPNNKPVKPKQKSCGIAWFAIGLLLLSWFFLLFGLVFFEKKNNKIGYEYALQWTQIQQKLSQNKVSYQELQKNLSQVQNFIQEKFSANETLLKISNIKHLINLAHYNLIYLRDPESALLALKIADKQLMELSNLPVSIETLRNLIKQNIDSLKALPSFDLSNTLAKVHALQMQITKLPLLKETSTLQKEKTTPHSNEKWFDAIQSNLHIFQQLIVIRHLNKPIEPLLPKVQQYYLQNNLQLLLQEAQWALLHNQQALYHSSLQQTKEILQQHFLESSSDTQTAIQDISELEKINLQPSFPDLNPTLQAITTLYNALSINSPYTQKDLSL